MSTTPAERIAILKRKVEVTKGKKLTPEQEYRARRDFLNDILIHLHHKEERARRREDDDNEGIETLIREGLEL